MKIGDRVIIKRPNPVYCERLNEWQIWRVIGIRKQATGIITELKGLCVKGTFYTGLSPDQLLKVEA